jgi:hypothetical protein
MMTALATYMEHDHQPADPRTTAQRRWDASVGIYRHYLESTPHTTRRGRPHVSVVIDLAELEGSNPELVRRARADALHTGRLSPATIELLTCDCEIRRVIVAGDSEVLDVGRASRTATPAQWHALVARDRHCQVPGCDRGPAHCDAHHIVHWTRGGETDLSNLVLLCWQHHRQHHLEGAATGRGRPPPYNARR